MGDEVQVFSLVLPGFAIDFDVKKEASIAFSERFGEHDKRFVFAVADIWVQVDAARYRLVTDQHPGNLIELLKGVEADLRKAKALDGMEALLPRGHWGRWMHGYWERLMNDFSAADDEAIYGQLIPFSLVDGHGGHVVAYRYNGLPTIEVATRPTVGDAPIYVWSGFDTELLAGQVRAMQDAISAHLRTFRH